MFDAIVISGEVGMRKPEPAIFAHTLDLLGCRRGRAVFVDDLRVNVTAATELGLVGVHHVTYDQTASELEALFGVPLRGVTCRSARNPAAPVHHLRDPQVVVQDEDVGHRACFQPSDVGPPQRAGRRARSHGGRVGQRHPELEHGAPEAVARQMLLPANEPLAPLSNFAPADLDVVVAETVDAVGQTTSRDGVADQCDAVVRSRPQQSRGHRVVQVDAVVDQLQDDAVTLENGKQDTGFTVMERTHAIAQMGCLRGAGIEGRGRDLVLAHRCARARRQHRGRRSPAPPRRHRRAPAPT